MWTITNLATMHGWDYRMFLWLGFLLFVILLLFVAAIAVFVGRDRVQKTET